jgi:hypothetical protein
MKMELYLDTRLQDISIFVFKSTKKRKNHAATYYTSTTCRTGDDQRGASNAPGHATFQHAVQGRAPSPKGRPFSSKNE